MNSYIYTFIRRDIPTAQKIVQIGHACHEAGKLLNKNENSEIPNLVLLAADNQEDLKTISRKLDCAGIEHTMFHEPDNEMGYSAICTRPVTDQRERAFFRKWELYRHIG